MSLYLKQINLNLQCSALLGDEKAIHVRLFHLKQPDFLVDSSSISGKASAGSHNPVARDDEGDGIMPYGSSHGLCRCRYKKRSSPLHSAKAALRRLVDREDSGEHGVSRRLDFCCIERPY